MEDLDAKDMRRYAAMSPFELEKVLVAAAQDAAGREGAQMLHAGRGNPNFLNTTVREALCHLQLFATGQADARLHSADLGLSPPRDGMAEKLRRYLESNRDSRGAAFLDRAITFAHERFKLAPEEFVYELADAALGDHYPSPPRIFPLSEVIVNAFLSRVHCPGHKPAAGKFDLFATEGATGAMIYVFNSLKENMVLNAGDHIAIVTPIFPPYLEIPELRDYNLVEVRIAQDEDLDWQVPDREMEKLEDPRIKAMFMVHPTNPTSVKLKWETLEKLAQLVETGRKDLIVLTDTVYATFVEDFHSVVEVIPRNTIAAYSYSKFFGVTGWRLGVVMLHEENVVDELISRLPAWKKAELDERYKIETTEPQKIKFIDRLEIDSRNVALAHTGGVSGPQHAIIALFSLFYLMDEDLAYQKAVHDILERRMEILYGNLNLACRHGAEHTCYYSLIDVERLARADYGDDFAHWLTDNASMIEFLFKLAGEKYTVCLPGEGFGAPRWSLRVSLANLEDGDYLTLGENINDVMTGYYRAWRG
ncbi:MAG: bifunctional aspartate transaminase/aspartate 4-decarboxylase [Actinobacteria bacterium]|jgi:aspartate 4-decarboxylase|nr:MAG: bifunctional aspartate transaminase/aspartate 4-decarboxylase [Actinomycetota bacterium]